ncbi:Hypothetical predicted protein, partial [Marmota monax]
WRGGGGRPGRCPPPPQGLSANPAGDHPVAQRVHKAPVAAPLAEALQLQRLAQKEELDGSGGWGRGGRQAGWRAGGEALQPAPPPRAA